MREQLAAAAAKRLASLRPCRCRSRPIERQQGPQQPPHVLPATFHAVALLPKGTDTQRSIVPAENHRKRTLAKA